MKCFGVLQTYLLISIILNVFPFPGLASSSTSQGSLGAQPGPGGFPHLARRHPPLPQGKLKSNKETAARLIVQCGLGTERLRGNLSRLIQMNVMVFTHCDGNAALGSFVTGKQDPRECETEKLVENENAGEGVVAPAGSSSSNTMQCQTTAAAAARESRP